MDLLAARPFHIETLLKAPIIVRIKKLARLNASDPELLTRISTTFGKNLEVIEIFALVLLSNYSEKYSSEIEKDNLFDLCLKCVQHRPIQELTSAQVQNKTVDLVHQLSEHQLIKYIPQKQNYLITGPAKKLGKAFVNAFDGSSMGFNVDYYTGMIIDIREKLQNWVTIFPKEIDVVEIEKFLVRYREDKVVFAQDRLIETIITVGAELRDLFERLLDSIALFRGKFIRLVHSNASLDNFKDEIEQEIDKYQKTINIYSNNAEDIDQFTIKSYENFEKCEELCILIQSQIGDLIQKINREFSTRPELVNQLINEIEEVSSTCGQVDSFVRNFKENVNSIILVQVSYLKHLLILLTQLSSNSVFTAALYRIWKIWVFDPLENPEIFLAQQTFPSLPQQRIGIQNFEVDGTYLQDFIFDWDKEAELQHLQQQIKETNEELKLQKKAAEFECKKDMLKNTIIIEIIKFITTSLSNLNQKVDLPQFIYETFKNHDLIRNNPEFFISVIYLKILSHVLNVISESQVQIPRDLGMDECKQIFQFQDGVIRVSGPNYIPRT